MQGTRICFFPISRKVRTIGYLVWPMAVVTVWPVYPPVPSPSRPAGGAGPSCANFLLAQGGGGEGWGQPTTTRTGGPAAPYCGLAGPARPPPPGYREFCGAGGDRLGQPAGSRVAPDLWVCEHQHISQSSLSLASVTKWSRGLTVTCCELSSTSPQDVGVSRLRPGSGGPQERHH